MQLPALKLERYYPLRSHPTALIQTCCDEKAASRAETFENYTTTLHFVNVTFRYVLRVLCVDVTGR